MTFFLVFLVMCTSPSEVMKIAFHLQGIMISLHFNNTDVISYILLPEFITGFDQHEILIIYADIVICFNDAHSQYCTDIQYVCVLKISLHLLNIKKIS